MSFFRMSLPLFPAARVEVFVLLQLPASVSRIDMVFATVLAFAMVLGLIAVFVLGIIALGTILSVPMFMVPFVDLWLVPLVPLRLIWRA